jgi:hypothetical protein
MKLLKFTLSILIIFSAYGYTDAQNGKLIKKESLKVLYVGQEVDSERTISFEKLLRDYFTTVKVIFSANYNPLMSDDYDVTIMDAKPIELIPAYADNKKGIRLVSGYLPYNFDRPMLTIGVISETVGRRLGSKNDWYCLCLDAEAHSWQPNHPIFNGPFKVKMTVETKPTPEGATHFPYFYDGPLPKNIDMWRVQTKGYKSDKDISPGLVARPWDYKSPDAENISSGVCDKTLDAVAIGRHGNYLHWGFSASPDEMTEEAKPVFANAIVYISKFAGIRPIERKFMDRIATREYIKERRYLLTHESYEARKILEAEFGEQNLKFKKEALEKQARGESLTADESRYLSYTTPPAKSYEEYFKEMASRGGGNLYDKFGMDIDSYNRYFDENYDYFFGEGFYNLEIDEDVKSLGIPNYDKRILDAAIKLLETGKDVAKARRILARYTLAHFATPQEWREWYNNYKNQMFWTESCGWLFLINSQEPGINDYIARQERRAASDLTIGETNDAEPVAIASQFIVLQNGKKILQIKIKIHPGYHIYDNVSNVDAYLPTAIDINLPNGYFSQGVMKRPFGGFYNQSGTTVYKDTVIFTQEISGKGTEELIITIDYQCCDSQICFPPQKKKFKVNLF